METLYPRLLREEKEPKEQEFGATLEEWKAFLRSRVWQDFVTFLEDSIEDGRRLLELTFAQRPEEIEDNYLRGGNEMLKRVLGFPFVQMAELELLMEHKEEDHD